jgi:hypothetical protein
MPQEDVDKLYFKYAANIDEALALVAEKHGSGYKAWVMPEAGMVLPTKSE